MKTDYWLNYVLMAWVLGVAIPAQATELPSFSQGLPVEGKVFDAVVDDVDEDGRLDLVLTLRSREVALILRQKEPRRFEAGSAASVTGVHADRLSLLASPPHRYLLCARRGGIAESVGSRSKNGIERDFALSSTPGIRRGGISVAKLGQSLAVSPYAGEEVTLVRNFQAEAGEAEASYALGVEKHSVPGEVSVADLDADGVDDLVYATRRTRTIWRISHPPQGQDPVPVVLWTVPEGHPRNVAIADLNGDGALDIVVPLDAARKIAVLLNNGKGKFTPGPELPFPTRFWGPASVVVGAGPHGTSLVVARSEQSLVFVKVEKNAAMRSEAVEWPLGAPSGQLLLLRDMDSDGSLDLVMNTNTATNNMRILYGPLWENVSQWAQQQPRPQTPPNGEIK
jgi:hypothetical protein